MTPIQRLRDFSVGDVVTLKGALVIDAPLIVSGITEDGYYNLHRSQKRIDNEYLPDVFAAGSHPVTTRKQ